MNTVVQKNFSAFKHNREEREQQRLENATAEEDQKVPESPEWNDTKTIVNLLKVNGKKSDEVIYSLLSQTFSEGDETLADNLVLYTDKLVRDKVFNTKDFNKGLSRFLQNFGEFAIDNPLIVE